jgi:hypothetical protein
MENNMFIALTLTTGPLTLINLDEVEQICISEYDADNAAIYLKRDPVNSILVSEDLFSIVKGLVYANQILKPMKDDKSCIR